MSVDLSPSFTMASAFRRVDFSKMSEQVMPDFHGSWVCNLLKCFARFYFKSLMLSTCFSLQSLIPEHLREALCLPLF